MPSSYTPNYQLNQWSRTDRVLMEDFNADNAKLDAALAAQAGTLAAHTETLAAHAGQIARLGNCAVYVGSYTGRGDEQPTTATVFGRPMAVFVQDTVDNFAIWAVRGMNAAGLMSGNTPYRYTLSWGDYSVSWTNGMSTTYSFNYKDRPYFYMVLATMDE